MNAQASDIYSTIREISDSFESTFSIGDVDTIAGFYTENGMLLPAESDFVRGKVDIKVYWQSAIDMGVKYIKIKYYRIRTA